MRLKMKSIKVASDIVPVGEFKTGIAKYLKNIKEMGNTLIITQNGRPAGVLLSPFEYDKLVDRKLFIDSVNRGLADVESGNIYTTKELKDELRKRRAKRKTK